MNSTEQHIHNEIQKVLKNKNLSLAEVARTLDTKPPHIHRMVNRQSGKIPDSLIDLLNALGLQITITQKD